MYQFIDLFRLINLTNQIFVLKKNYKRSLVITRKSLLSWFGWLGHDLILDYDQDHKIMIKNGWIRETPPYDYLKKVCNLVIDLIAKRSLLPDALLLPNQKCLNNIIRESLLLHWKFCYNPELGHEVINEINKMKIFLQYSMNLLAA